MEVTKIILTKIYDFCQLASHKCKLFPFLTFSSTIELAYRFLSHSWEGMDGASLPCLIMFIFKCTFLTFLKCFILLWNRFKHTKTLMKIQTCVRMLKISIKIISLRLLSIVCERNPGRRKINLALMLAWKVIHRSNEQFKPFLILRVCS
jgi:hypothetical protein